MQHMVAPTEAEWLAAQAEIASLKNTIAMLYQRLEMADVARRRMQQAADTMYRSHGSVAFPRQRVALADGRQGWFLEEAERLGVLRAREAFLRDISPSGAPVVQMQAADLAEQVMRAPVTSGPRGPRSRPLGTPAPTPPSRPLTPPAGPPRISAIDLRVFNMTLDDLANILDGGTWPLTCPRCGDTVHRLTREDLANLDRLDRARIEWGNQLQRHLRIRHPEPARG